MSHLFIWIFYWLCLSAFVAAIYVLTVRGQLYCAAMLVGHWWAVLKEEVCRPVRLIKEILGRKRQRDIHLDEYERHLS
jgi:hypothetical protein